jgi:hypothetical protein
MSTSSVDPSDICEFRVSEGDQLMRAVVVELDGRERFAAIPLGPLGRVVLTSEVSCCDPTGFEEAKDSTSPFC